MVRSRFVADRAVAHAGNGVTAAFADEWAALLTTYRSDGTAVRTPVNVAVEGRCLLFRTYEQSGKFKRLKGDPRVTLQPCDYRGRVTRDVTLHGVARLLEGRDEARAARAIDGKHPFFQRAFVRLGHRLRGYRTVHFAIDPSGAQGTISP